MTKEEIEKATSDFLDENGLDINDKDDYTCGVRDGFSAGAQFRQKEIDELLSALREATEWVDVDQEYPDGNRHIIFKCNDGRISNGWFATRSDSVCFFIRTDNIVSWRYIDNPKAVELLKKYSDEK